MSENNENRLSEEDQKRVEEYLSGPVQRVDRKPFRPLLLLFWLWVVVMGLGGVAWLFGRIEGYI
jgi:Protein of unknown function (DUF3094).